MSCIISLCEVRLNLLVGLFTVFLIVVTALSLCIASIVSLLTYLFTQLFIVYFVVILTLYVSTTCL